MDLTTFLLVAITANLSFWLGYRISKFCRKSLPQPVPREGEGN